MRRVCDALMRALMPSVSSTAKQPDFNQIGLTQALVRRKTSRTQRNAGRMRQTFGTLKRSVSLFIFRSSKIHDKICKVRRRRRRWRQQQQMFSKIYTKISASFEMQRRRLFSVRTKYFQKKIQCYAIEHETAGAEPGFRYNFILFFRFHSHFCTHSPLSDAVFILRVRRSYINGSARK